MVKKKLVEGLIRDGAKLLRELDRQEFPVESMFWTHLLDEDYWRLVVASPLAAQDVAAAYGRLNRVLQGTRVIGITLEDISLLDPESQQFRGLLSLAKGYSKVGPGEEWFELEDAVVYRWTGESATGELNCHVSERDLKDFWEAERGLTNLPALLISSAAGRVTLRFHPQHQPGDIQEVKKHFRFALHRPRPDCDVTWLPEPLSPATRSPLPR